MTRSLALPCSLFLALRLLAGSGGPDTYGYTWKDNLEPDGPVFSWIDITGTGIQVMGLADDNVVGPFVMQTNHEYYWYNRKNLWIGSNGYVAFMNGNIASPFPVIPTAAGTNDYIAAMMSDLNFGGAGNPAQCWLLDNAQTTIISYINVPFWQQAAPYWTGSNTFQIILNKVDSTVTFQYLQQTGLTMNNDLTVGIESVAGSIGLQHSKNIYPIAGRAIRFYRPATPLITVTDAAVNWSGQPGSQGRFRSRNGSNLVLEGSAVNIGTTFVNNFTVTASVLNSANQVLVTASQNVAQLFPLQDTVITYGPTWAPTTAGTFRHRVAVSGVAGDLVAPNNQRDQEIVVVDTTTTTHDLRFHGTVDDGIGVAWSGGNGGIGVHIVPPYHPCQISHYTVRIVQNPSTLPFQLKLFRDDGPNGAPGTLLDEITVSGANAGPGDKVLPLGTPQLITSGGVYVLWYMMGENIAIARDANPPFSLRTYEVLDGTWAEYRDREASDFFLGVRLSQVPVLNAGCSGFFEPVNGQVIGSPTPVRAWIRNYGNQPISNVPISYRYNGGPIVSQTYTGTAIQPGQQALYTFTQAFNPTTDGIGDLCAWTGLAGDISAANDTACISISTVTGTAETARPPLVLAPNPNDGRFLLTGLQAGAVDVELFDATGRSVLRRSGRAEQGAMAIDAHVLPAGNYRCVVRQANAVVHRALVVQR